MKLFTVLGAIIAIAFSISLVPVPAQAAEFYGKLEVGVTANAEVEGFGLQDDLAYGAALGADLGVLRVEAGVSRISADVLSIAQVSALDHHATAFVDFALTERSTFFAGAGVDYVDAEANFFGSSLNADGKGWHYAIGGAYRLNDRMIGEVQFRHVEADMSSDYGDFDLAADEVSVGLRLAL